MVIYKDTEAIEYVIEISLLFKTFTNFYREINREFLGLRIGQVH